MDWLEGPLWLVGLDTGRAQVTDPLKFLARVAPMFDAQRHNATGPFGAHPRDGYFHHLLKNQVAAVTSIAMAPPTANTASFRGGNQWGPFPPITNLIFAGPGVLEVKDAGDLPPLSRALLELVTQKGTRVHFARMRNNYDISRGRLLCARSAVVMGAKPKFFTGRSDGWMFRQYGYMLSGVSRKPRSDESHPKFSPRKIVWVDAPPGSSSVWNRAAVLDILRASGLEVIEVPNILSLPFSEQVRLMSTAGVLVGPHSPSLALTTFLPQHSVVIDLTPAGVKHLTLRYLTLALDLHHMPVHSYVMPPCDGSDAPPASADGTPNDVATKAARAAAAIMHGDEYYARCTKRNISSFDALLEHVCWSAHMTMPIVVPLEIFKRTLFDAIDTIGAFSLLHPEWEREWNRTGGGRFPLERQINWKAKFRKY